MQFARQFISRTTSYQPRYLIFYILFLLIIRIPYFFVPTLCKIHGRWIRFSPIRDLGRRKARKQIFLELNISFVHSMINQVALFVRYIRSHRRTEPKNPSKILKYREKVAYMKIIDWFGRSCS
jgi:hypothetical protein